MVAISNISISRSGQYNVQCFVGSGTFMLLIYDTVFATLMMCMCTTMNEHLQYNEILQMTKPV